MSKKDSIARRRVWRERSKEVASAINTDVALKRWKATPPETRKEHARMMAVARWEAYRKARNVAEIKATAPAPAVSDRVLNRIATLVQ
jgi:hypothetical protein